MQGTVLLLTSKLGPPISLETALVKQLPDYGMDVVLACHVRGPLLEEAEARGIPALVLPGLGDWRTIRSALYLLPTLRRLKQIVASHGVKLIHSLRGSTTPIALLLSHLTGVPHLCHIRFLYGSKDKYRKLWLDRADNVAALSRALLASFLAACRDRRPARTAVTYFGIDATRFEADGHALDVRGEYGIAGSAPVLGMVGSLDALKDPQALIRAAEVLVRRWPALRLLFVGKFRKQTYHSETLALVEAVGLADRCQFVGFQANPSPYFRAMDVLVHPSRGDALPRVLLEAMAHSKPIVATRVGGIPEAVQHGRTGLLVEPGDVGALAGAIDSLLADGEQRRALGERGRRRLDEEFSLAQCLTRIVRLYSEIAGHREYGREPVRHDL